MRDRRDEALESELTALYRSERSAWRRESGADEDPAGCVRPCGAEAADRARDARIAVCIEACEGELEAVENTDGASGQLGKFLSAQARFTRPVTWAAFAAVAAVAVVGGWLGAGDPLALQALSATGGLLALICLAGVTRSRSFGMAELEAACPFNAVSVAFARLLLMGGTSLLVLALAAIFAGSQGLGAANALALMGTPYLVACAGGLMCARRVSSADARAASITWASTVTAVAALLFYIAPSAYAATSAWVWACACLAAGCWCAREVRAWLGAGASAYLPEAGPAAA